tara:strand:- start:165 stop:671 length:507 start_codon:yes stop_codon:yes gene_type:complete
MPMSTAAISLAQLEIIKPNVVQRDKMIRILSDKLSAIPGISTPPIPEYMNIYSCWMAGFSINLEEFTCDSDTFAQEVADEGIPGAGLGRYYLIPAALPFLTEKAEKKIYPYSMPPASKSYVYDGNSCPNAQKFLNTYIRWSSFCERYTVEDCELATEIVRTVADKYRK